MTVQREDYCDPWQRDSAVRVLDSLIAAAREEGFEKGRAEGAEEAKPKIAESTEKLIDWILAIEPPYEGANPQWGRKVLLDLVATAAATERERIMRGSERFPQGAVIADSNYTSFVYGKGEPETWADCDLFVTPASLLAPDKESEK